MNPRTTESRSLVILISWVAAQDQKSKFEDLWHRRNFDVIKIRIRYPDTLIPVFTLIPRGKLIADWLLELSDHYDNIVFHTLSAGSYVYSMIVNTIVSQKELYQGLEPILKGAVFDSLLDWDETTPERAKNFQRMMKKYSARVIPKYYRYTYFYSTNTFMHSLELLERNPLDIPGLWNFILQKSKFKICCSCFRFDAVCQSRSIHERGQELSDCTEMGPRAQHCLDDQMLDRLFPL